MKARLTHGRRGAVLLATLLFIYLLAIIVTIFIEEVVDRIKYRTQTVGDVELRRVAYDFLEHSLAVMAEFKEFDGAFHHPIEGWGSPLDHTPFPVEIEGLSAQVSIVPNNDRIPIRLVTETDFESLMETIGINPHDAGRYRDSYFDWTDADDETLVQGAELQEYERDRMAYLNPPNQEIESFEEFKNMMHYRDWFDPESRFYGPERLEVLKRILSIESSNPVNLNIAGADVLEFLRLRSDFRPNEIWSYFAGQDRLVGTSDDQYLESREDIPVYLLSGIPEGEADSWISFESTEFRIQIELLKHNSATFRLEAWVSSDPDASNAAQGAPEEENQNENQETAPPPESAAKETNESANSGFAEVDGFEILVIQEKFLDGE
ncbi:MAG: general secretion pathway protein GspK [Opitutales bacterium]|nr:general secretion pathway protein GspK [Opitutales bacterium]